VGSKDGKLSRYGSLYGASRPDEIHNVPRVMIDGATIHSLTDPPWTLQTLFMRVFNDRHAEGSHKVARAARATWQLEANLRP